jgi:tetratricopeptide (TPR) repeat protein
MNAQLIECATGGHIWAERFDANRTDLLEMQDEVVTRIARTLQVQLASVAAARIKRARASDVDAEAAALRAESLFLHYGVSLRAEQEGCLRLCEDVLEKNPQNVRALGILGLTHAIRVLIRQSSDRDADLARAEELSARALAADPMSYLAHHAQAAALQARRRLAESIVEDERALELNPVYIGTYVTLCNGYLALGQPETSIAYAERAIRLSPRDPVLFGLYARKGEAEFAALLDDSATVSLRRSLAFAQSESTVYAHLAAALAFKGELDEARSLLAQGLALKQARNRTIAEWRSQEISDHPRYRAYCDRLYDGLQKAGMPES